MSKIIQSWRVKVSLHSASDESLVSHQEESLRLTLGNSSAIGKLLFEKVVAALGDDVKATLRFG